MLAVIAASALIVAVLYGFIGLYIVPRLARLAVRKGSLISFAQYGAAAFFLGCAMTHIAIAVHVLEEPELVKGHEWFHLVPHILQIVGGALFSVIAWTRLDVQLRTKEDARLEEEGERLRDQLERSQRLGSLGQLAGGLAHDFNNLLVVILGYGRLLEKKLDHDPAARADVHEIVGAAQRGADLTRQMLVFSRGPEVSLDATDIHAAVEASATLLRRAVGESVRVELDLADGLPLVRLGRGQIEQILLNLALNARDAMPSGGALKIRASCLPSTDGDGDGVEGVRLTVADTGQGMSSDVLAKAFDPFFTTKPEGEGTGLGLSMVFRMVERVGGRVDLESAPGHGTRITIELPGTQCSSAEAVHEHEPLQLHGVTVLLVEDARSVRVVAARTLRARGASIIEAADGEEALRQFDQHADAIDVVLTDVVMPAMTGVELGAALHREHPTLPIVYTSGTSAEELSLPAGALLVCKPFTGDDLVEAIADALPVSFLAGH